ncbi:hypothetical protein [Niallia circulans]|nr:hypothetical protein [Niallia circulans]
MPKKEGKEIRLNYACLADIDIADPAAVALVHRSIMLTPVVEGMINV